MNLLSHDAQLEPLSSVETLLFFCIPALVYFVAFHHGMHALTKRGLKSFYAYCICMVIPSMGLLVAALVAYSLEGNVLNWPGLMERFNYHTMSIADWLWTLGSLVVIFIGYGAGMQVTKSLIRNGRLHLPASLPAWLDPRSMDLRSLDQSMGGLPGNWKALLVFFCRFYFQWGWRRVLVERLHFSQTVGGFGGRHLACPRHIVGIYPRL